MTETDVAQLAAAVFGKTPAYIERLTLTHSGNSIYAVAIGDSTAEFIFRLRDRAGAFDGTGYNIEALRKLGLPVPQVVAADSSLARFPFSWMILKRMPGRDLYYELPGMTGSEVTRLAEQIAGFQHDVSTLPEGTGFGWGRIGEGGASQSWRSIFASWLDGLSPVAITDEVEALRTRISALCIRFASYFDSVRPTCFLEDLTTKNVLVRDGKLQGLIDFDGVCFGDPLWMIGLTAGCIVNDLGTGSLFYVKELERFWNLSETQRSVVAIYAAIRALEFAVGALAAGDVVRADRLLRFVDDCTGATQEPYRFLSN